jgi:hypothetical protein
LQAVRYTLNESNSQEAESDLAARRKEDHHKRAKTLIFRVSKPEYEHFSQEARKRHMDKAELFRYLLARYFFDDEPVK